MFTYSRLFQIVVRSGGGWEGGVGGKSPPFSGGGELQILLGEVYRMKGTSGGVIVIIQIFFKALNYHCEY